MRSDFESRSWIAKLLFGVEDMGTNSAVIFQSSRFIAILELAYPNRDNSSAERLYYLCHERLQTLLRKWEMLISLFRLRKGAC